MLHLLHLIHKLLHHSSLRSLGLPFLSLSEPSMTLDFISPRVSSTTLPMRLDIDPLARLESEPRRFSGSGLGGPGAIIASTSSTTTPSIAVPLSHSALERKKGLWRDARDPTALKQSVRRAHEWRGLYIKQNLPLTATHSDLCLFLLWSVIPYSVLGARVSVLRWCYWQLQRLQFRSSVACTSAT